MQQSANPAQPEAENFLAGIQRLAVVFLSFVLALVYHVTLGTFEYRMGYNEKSPLVWLVLFLLGPAVGLVLSRRLSTRGWQKSAKLLGMVSIQVWVFFLLAHFYSWLLNGYPPSL